MVLWDELLDVTAEAGRICVGLVFVLAAAQKLLHWRLLPGVIGNYRLLPTRAVGPVTALLPPLEMLLAISLLSGQFKPWSAAATVAVLMVFAAAIAVNVARGRIRIDCGCGQNFLVQHLSWALVARNFMLAALLLPSLAADSSLPWADILTGIAVGIAFFLLYLLLNLFCALPTLERQRFA